MENGPFEDYFLLKMVMFHCHVSLLEGNNIFSYTRIPSFGLKRPCFEGLTFKNRGHSGSRCIYVQVYMFIYIYIFIFIFIVIFIFLFIAICVFVFIPVRINKFPCFHPSMTTVKNPSIPLPYKIFRQLAIKEANLLEDINNPR